MAVGITFTEFRSNVKEVARPNRFLLSFPSAPPGVAGFNFSEEMQYHVRTGALPGRVIGEIANLFWFGLNFKVAGDPSYDDISITFLNSTSFNLKKLMEDWINLIANPITNERASHADYKAVMKMDQLGKGSNIIGTYYMHGVSPKSIQPVELSQESVDTLEEFTVDFSMDYWSNDSTPDSGEGTVLVGKTL